MNRTLTATCFYCDEMCKVLEGMISKDELTESNVKELIDFWRQNSTTNHCKLVKKYTERNNE